MTATRCKSCKAEIVWGITEQNNKRVPMDARSERRFVAVGQAENGAPIVRLRETYLSHFATCPQADEHRRAEGK